MMYCTTVDEVLGYVMLHIYVEGQVHDYRISYGALARTERTTVYISRPIIAGTLSSDFFLSYSSYTYSTTQGLLCCPKNGSPDYYVPQVTSEYFFTNLDVRATSGSYSIEYQNTFPVGVPLVEGVHYNMPPVKKKRVLNLPDWF